MPGYRKLPSGKWQATIRTPNGRRTRTDAYKNVVRTWAEEEEAKIRRGEWADPRDGRLTVGEWWAQWSAARDVELATERREESHWRVHIKPRWGHIPLGRVTAWEVEAWAGFMNKAGVGLTTRGQVLRLMRTLMSEATRHRLIASDPTSSVRIPAPPRHVDRILTRAEYQRLEDAVTDPAMVAMIRLLTFAGLRWAEAAGLHAHRVDLGRGQIEVVETLRRDGSIKPAPKSIAGRRKVPVVPAVAEVLAPLLGDGLVFRAPNGGPLDYTNWRRDVWVPARDRAQLTDPQPTPHDLRHTFGSWLAEHGVPPHEIAATMGHSTLRATERYLHAGDGRLERARLALT